VSFEVSDLWQIATFDKYLMKTSDALLNLGPPGANQGSMYIWFSLLSTSRSVLRQSAGKD
jgi:hypothetical protein